MKIVREIVTPFKNGQLFISFVLSIQQYVKIKQEKVHFEAIAFF